jgi:hypothetical protein
MAKVKIKTIYKHTRVSKKGKMSTVKTHKRNVARKKG